MTREEAINILWMYDVNFEPHPAEEVMHAIDMAIEALRQPEIVRCKDCKYHIPQDGRCRLWCQFVDQSEWCSRAKRKDGEADAEIR